jgi:signal transduction histidine kinase
MMEAEICIPLITKEKLIGLISFGEKANGGVYSTEDIELLGTLANQASIAIENARLYEDLKKQKAIMRRADRLAALGTLTAGLAHEIRNPLVAIKTLTQLLPERLDDEEFRSDFLKIASGEVDRISSLVNELLEFARPTSPHLRLESIQQIMDGMILLISTETKKKNLDIVAQYEDNLPSIPVDREQIKQVFLNVLLNAIEATGEGGCVSVDIRIFSRKNGENFLQIEIRDTGRGIPEEHLDNVFTPFFTTKDKGSGLGLSISHQIVQEHGGTISVESRIGEGSSFFINFPISLDVREGAVAAERDTEAA